MHIHLILGFFFGATSFIFAAPVPVSLPKIIVQAPSLPEPAPLDSADVTRITAQEIEQQQFVTVADVLRRVPGVYVSQNGGIGQEARVSLRGTGGSRTATVLDGMAINDPGAFDEAFNLSRLTLDDISDIQVIRGPMSSLFGPNGIGGVLLIETKKGQGSHKTFARAEGGAFCTYTQVLGVQGRKNQVDYHITGARLQSAGPSTIPNAYRQQVQGKINNPLHQDRFSARLGMGDESAHISLISRYLSRRLGFRQNFFDQEPWRQNLSETFNRLKGHFESLEGRWIHEVGLGYYQSDVTNRHPLKNNVHRKGTQIQLDGQQIFQATHNLQVQIAADVSQEKLDRHLEGSLATEWKASHAGMGGVLTFKAMDNLTLTGSVRMDKYQNIASTTTYRFGSIFCFGKIKVKGGLGTAFKAPTLQQKFYKDAFFSGNPKLKPERSLGWDIGVERPFLSHRLTLGMTLFQNRIRDLITGSSNLTTLVNSDKSRTQGIEGTVNFHLTQEWDMEFSHTYTQAWDEKTKQRLIANPLNKTAFRLIGHFTPQWEMSGNVLYIGTRDSYSAVTFQRIRKPGYTIFGAETSYQLNDQWQIYGRGENLFNRRYEDPDGFQQPGFGIYAGVRAQW